MNAAALNPDPLLDTKQAAAYRGLSPKTLQNERWRGIGPRYIRQGGFIAYRRSDLERYLAECAVETEQSAKARQSAASLTPALTRTRRNARIREIAAEFQSKPKRLRTDRRSAGKARADRSS